MSWQGSALVYTHTLTHIHTSMHTRKCTHKHLLTHTISIKSQAEVRTMQWHKPPTKVAGFRESPPITPQGDTPQSSLSLPSALAKYHQECPYGLGVWFRYVRGLPNISKALGFTPNANKRPLWIDVKSGLPLRCPLPSLDQSSAWVGQFQALWAECEKVS